MIIQKLRWQRRKDLDDVVGVLAVSGPQLDRDYLAIWTEKHQTSALLQELAASVPDLGDLAPPQ